MARRRNLSTIVDKKRHRFIERLAAITERSTTAAEKLAFGSPKASFWINPLRGDVDDTTQELESIGVKSVSHDLENAFGLQSDKHELAESSAFTEGRIYIQNLSSMLAVKALDPQPGEEILDVCASPGGKSARAASLTNNEILLWANDSIKSRVTKMQKVFNQYGVKTTQVLCHPGQYLDKFVEHEFDRIILDAQCSGEAMIDLSRPSTLQYWSEKRIKECSYLQQRMLMSAWKLLKPGGTLVYSTCTYGPEENESPVDHLLKHGEGAEVIPFALPIDSQSGVSEWNGQKFDPQLKGALRVLPGEYTEAFLICVLRKQTS